MKKRFIIFLITLFVLFLSACSAKEEDFYILLNEYSNLKEVKLLEKTDVIDKNGVLIQATKTINVNSNNYFAEIENNNGEGYITRVDNKFYYLLGDTFKSIDYTYSDVYSLIGIDYIFKIKDYDISNGVAKKTIKTPNVSYFKNLISNTSNDLEKDYQYDTVNPIKIEIKFNKEEIKEIKIDISETLKKGISSAIKTIVFLSDSLEFYDKTQEIESKLENLVNTDFKVNTGNILDTYVIEMVYQYGDSIYIKSGDFDMLIDAGQKEDGPNINKLLLSYCDDKKLDVLIGTHGHGDHLGGFSNGALNNINSVGLIIDYGYADGGNSKTYESIRDSYVKLGAKYYSAYDCVNYTNGGQKKYKFSDDLSLEVLNTNQYAKTGSKATSDNENDYSVVVKLQFKNHSYLFSGDISGDELIFEESLMKEDIENITVYKAAHHGSSTHNTNSKRFLEFINPEICLISAAIVDSFNPFANDHPSKIFLSRLYELNKISSSRNVYFNGTMGTIHLVDNGINNIGVTGFGATKGYYYNGAKVTGENSYKLDSTIFYQKR